MDGNRRDEVLSRMPAHKIETRLQGALRETLCLLVELGDVALSFTDPSHVFLIETTMKSSNPISVEWRRIMAWAGASLGEQAVVEGAALGGVNLESS
jgi:hypothetical protein